MMQEVIDNFFTEEQNEKIIELLSRPQWSFTGGGIQDGISSMFWHMDNLERDEYFLDLYKEIITRLKIQNASLVRCYANGQTAGQSGVPHQDDGDLTVLYFPLPWEHYLGGHLNFVDGDDIKSVIEYKQYRLVLFPASTTHYAGSPDRQYLGLRVSLAFKIKLEKS